MRRTEGALQRPCQSWAVPLQLQLQLQLWPLQLLLCPAAQAASAQTTLRMGPACSVALTGAATLATAVAAGGGGGSRGAAGECLLLLGLPPPPPPPLRSLPATSETAATGVASPAASEAVERPLGLCAGTVEGPRARSTGAAVAPLRGRGMLLAAAVRACLQLQLRLLLQLLQQRQLLQLQRQPLQQLQPLPLPLLEGPPQSLAAALQAAPPPPTPPLQHQPL
jgi:hypothetical protein